MYLKRLKFEQKELFLDLCVKAAMANNVLEETEKKMISEYCEEMGIERANFDVSSSTHDIIENLSEISSGQELRMMLVELTALMLSDEEFDSEEQQFMNAFIDLTDVTYREFSVIKEKLAIITDSYAELNKVVFG